MRIQTAEHIIPRVTCVRSIKNRQRETVGYTSRCDCGSREDHMFDIDGTSAHGKAMRHSLYHSCRRGSVPWTGHLTKGTEDG